MSKKEASYIEDNLIKIKKCFSGVVLTTDGRYLTAVEVLPINFTFKTGNEKESIISQFEKYLKVAPVKMQIKTLSKKTNVAKLMSVLDEKYKSFPNKTKAIDEIHQDELNLINRLGSREGVERHFYFIFEYVPTDSYVAKDEEDIVFYLNSAKNTIRQFLYTCGNTVITHKDEDLFMLELCYQVLNKHKSKSDLYDEWNSLVDAANEYYDYDEEKLDSLEVPYTNLVAPNKIQIFSNYCKIEDTYYTFLFIPSDQYPSCINPAWLAGLINSGEGIDVDIFLRRESTNRVRNQIRTKIRINGVRAKSMDPNGANYEELAKSLDASDYIKSRLAQGDSLYYINTMVTISGESFDEMYAKYSAVKEMLEATDIECMECKHLVPKAIQAYLPLNDIDKFLFEKTKRNITTSDLAAFYPPTSFEVSDDDGIIMGKNRDNSSLCTLDNFNRSKYKNGNMAILGTTGAGKTFTLGTCLKRLAMQGVKTYLIAPLKGYEYYRTCKSIGGQVIKLSTGSPHCINIMEIRPENMERKQELGLVADESDEIILNKKVDNLLVFFSLIISDISLEEKELLDDVILKTYAQFGITKDNNSLIDSYKYETMPDGKVIKKPIYKKMPILEDLYNNLNGVEKTQRMANILKRYVTGSASSFNGQTNVNLDSPFTVIDISALSDELLPIGMFIAVDYVWDKAKEDVVSKKAIAIDETWLLIKNSLKAAKFVLEIFKIIRGYGGIAIAASQDINDFFMKDNGEYGKAIISNSKIKIILQLEPDEADTVQEILNLSNRERKDIESFERGNMLVVSNANTFSLEFIASEIEEKLITTDAKKLEELKNDKRFKNGIFVGSSDSEEYVAVEKAA